jgi:hypothetical protein
MPETTTDRLKARVAEGTSVAGAIGAVAGSVLVTAPSMPQRGGRYVAGTGSFIAAD